MKSKRLLLMVALFAIALQCAAQMVLKAPKWEKFVKINTENINVRKAPNANSPKLMSRGSDWYLELSWRAQREFEPFHFDVGAVLPVLKETPEWYCLYFDDQCYAQLRGSYEVYVMKKFCTEVTPVAMSNKDISWSENEFVKGGTGYLVGVYFLGSPSRAPWCRIGHKFGKGVVMADYDDAMDFAYNYVTGETTMEKEFHIEKVRESDVTKFIRSKTAPHIFDVWYKFAGIDMPCKFVFDASTYQYPVSSITITPAATTASNSSDVFDRVDQMPSFPGGGSALMQYLSSHVRYPKTTASGRVVLQFVVERDGSISNTKVVRSIDPALDREAVRVVSSMPNWNPGMKDGKPVRVKYTIPINFSK